MVLHVSFLYPSQAKHTLTTIFMPTHRSVGQCRLTLFFLQRRWYISTRYSRLFWKRNNVWWARRINDCLRLTLQSITLFFFCNFFRTLAKKRYILYQKHTIQIKTQTSKFLSFHGMEESLGHARFQNSSFHMIY